MKCAGPCGTLRLGFCPEDYGEPGKEARGSDGRVPQILLAAVWTTGRSGLPSGGGCVGAHRGPFGKEGLTALVAGGGWRSQAQAPEFGLGS